MPTIYKSLVAAYAKAIYIDGTKRFVDIRTDYVELTKIYAATGVIEGALYQPSFTGYSDFEIANARDNGWISQLEYDQTMAYRTTTP